MSETITPSRMNLALYKQKIIGAKKGHELLKKKCDALKAKFRQVSIALLDNKKQMGEKAQTALLLFAKAQWAAGEFHQNVKDAVKRPTIRIDRLTENIAGVMIPIMHIKESDDSENEIASLGLNQGGAQIQIARESFKDLLTLLIKIASQQASFISLDIVIKVTNRRVNALEHIVIPKFQRIQAYIQLEIDEVAREEFYRIKKILDNKRKAAELAEREKLKKSEELKLKGESGFVGGETSAQIFDEGKYEEDVLF